MNELVEARYYSDNFSEEEVLKGRTIPLGGLLKWIGVIVFVGLAHNAFQSVKTRHAARTATPAKVSDAMQKFDAAKAIGFHVAEHKMGSK
jgi:hypothetical protein